MRHLKETNKTNSGHSKYLKEVQKWNPHPALKESCVSLLFLVKEKEIVWGTLFSLGNVSLGVFGKTRDWTDTGFKLGPVSPTCNL